MNRRQTLHPVTAVVNKQQQNQSQIKRSHALAWLAKQFPHAFDNTTRIRPLKIGILNDLLELSEQAAKENISRSKLREAVVVFTRRVDYLTCLKNQEMRIDLYGNPVCPVNEEEAAQAAEKIRRLIEKRSRKMLQTTEAAPAEQRFTPTATFSSTGCANIIIKPKKRILQLSR